MKPEQAKAVYDGIGRMQDWQFYEDRAVAQLLADSAFLGAAHAVAGSASVPVSVPSRAVAANNAAAPRRHADEGQRAIGVL